MISFSIFYLRLKKKLKNQRALANKNGNENSTTTMHVDWDKIDNAYTEDLAINAPHSTNTNVKTNLSSFNFSKKSVNPSNLNHQTHNLAITNILKQNNNHSSNSPDAVYNIPVKPSVNTQDMYTAVKPDEN